MTSRFEVETPVGKVVIRTIERSFTDQDSGRRVTRFRAQQENGQLDFGGDTARAAYYNLVQHLSNPDFRPRSETR